MGAGGQVAPEPKGEFGNDLASGRRWSACGPEGIVHLSPGFVVAVDGRAVGSSPSPVREVAAEVFSPVQGARLPGFEGAVLGVAYRHFEVPQVVHNGGRHAGTPLVEVECFAPVAAGGVEVGPEASGRQPLLHPGAWDSGRNGHGSPI